MNSLAPIFLISLSLLLGACLSFPDADNTPDDGGIDASVIDAAVTDGPVTDAPPEGDAVPDAVSGLVGHTIVGNVADTTLSNGNHELRFSAANGFLIESLELQDDPSTVPRNLIYPGTGREKFAGVHSWDALSFQWDADPVYSELARGEAVYRFQLISTHLELSVRSIYTIYPDGRIHRDEDATITTAGSLSAYLALNPATEDSGTTLSTFTSVASDYDGTSIIGTASSPTHVHSESDSPDNSGTGFGWACAYGAELMMGMAHQIGPLKPSSHRPRTTVSGNGVTNTLLSLIYDWASVSPQREDAAINESYTGNFIMAGGLVGTTGNECQRIEDLESWLFGLPSELTLAEGTLAEPGEGDDNSDGYNEGGGFWALRSNDGSSLGVTIDTVSGGRIAPERAAFRLHGLTLPQNQVPLITLNGLPQTRGQDFLWQGEVFGGNAADIVHWVYFGRALADDDTLVFSTN